MCSPSVFFILHATAKYFFDAEFSLHTAFPAGFDPYVRKIDFVVRNPSQFHCII